MTTHAHGNHTSTSTSSRRLWTARVLKSLVLLFLAFDSGVKLLNLDVAVQANAQLGYPASLVAVIGIIELACAVLYALPRTSALGALLLTGYLGGAIASQLRAGNPLISHTLFPVYVGALVWGGVSDNVDLIRALLGSRRTARRAVGDQAGVALGG